MLHHFKELLNKLFTEEISEKGFTRNELNALLSEVDKTGSFNR